MPVSNCADDVSPDQVAEWNKRTLETLKVKPKAS